MTAVFARFKIRYVLSGGVAARLHGFPWMTAIVEIVPAVGPNEFESLATALKHLSAQIYTEGTPDGLPFETTADGLGRAANWSFITSCGRLDVRFRPEGSGGFASRGFPSHSFAGSSFTRRRGRRGQDSAGLVENLDRRRGDLVGLDLHAYPPSWESGPLRNTATFDRSRLAQGQISVNPTESRVLLRR